MSLPSRHYAALAEHAAGPAPPYAHDALRIDAASYAVAQRVDRPSGYRGTIYRRADTGEYVIAHVGGEWLRQADRDDAGLATVGRRIAAHSDDALALTRQALVLASALPATTVSVTGHSLGGGLAQIAAHRFGLRGETFNAYGAAGPAWGIPEGGRQMLNHVMAGDAVSAAGRHFGRVRAYALAQDVWRLHELDRHPPHGGIADQGHSLAAVAALRDSHRLQHFLDGGGDGRSRTVLDDPAARYRAQAHQPMFERYRRGVFALCASLALAVARRGADAGLGPAPAPDG